MDYSKLIKIIPTYNEKKNISPLARQIFSFYPQASVLVVDDNSPDGTAKAVSELKVEFANLDLLHRKTQKGFGRSYIEGLKKVMADNRYEYVVMMDADFSHDSREVSGMLAKLTDYDVVNGSRYVKGGGIKNWKRHRRVLSRFANFYAGKILGAGISDMTTGFVCLRKDVLKKVDLDSISSDGYAFLIELKYRLLKAGAKFCEHPITYTERREGGSKMSSKIIWESVWLPWKLKFSRKTPVTGERQKSF